jgi:pimeloyl-ACP methyl ester carboxylesterase
MENTFKLTTADKHRIPVIHARRGGERLVAASHGITSEKTEEGLYKRFIKLLPPSYDVLLFDFRGHGDSKMRSTEVTIAGEVLDLMTVFNWAREQKYSSIDHVATSFGASIALLAVDGYRLNFLRKTVFWNPVINYWSTFIESTVEWAQSYFDQERIEELSTRPFTKITDSKFRISALMTQELLLLHPERVVWPALAIGDKGLVVYGPNGVGKSSIIDALEATIRGQSSLFKDNRAEGVNWDDASTPRRANEVATSSRIGLS